MPFWATFHFKWHSILSDIPFWITFHFRWHSILSDPPIWVTLHFKWHSAWVTFHFACLNDCQRLCVKNKDDCCGAYWQTHSTSTQPTTSSDDPNGSSLIDRPSTTPHNVGRQPNRDSDPQTKVFLEQPLLKTVQYPLSAPLSFIPCHPSLPAWPVASVSIRAN